MSNATRWQVQMWNGEWVNAAPRFAAMIGAIKRKDGTPRWPRRLGSPTCSRCGREEGSTLSRYGDVDPMGGVVGLTTCEGCGRVLCGECDAEGECGCD